MELMYKIEAAAGELSDPDSVNLHLENEAPWITEKKRSDNW